MMRQQPIRRNVPIKGMNTVAPKRNFSDEYSPSIVNCWYDDGVTLKRRLCALQSNTAILPNPIKTMFEYKVTLQDLFIQDSVTGLVSKLGVNSITPTTATFANKVRTATLNKIMVCGDGIGAAQIYNGATFTPFSTPQITTAAVTSAMIARTAAKTAQVAANAAVLAAAPTATTPALLTALTGLRTTLATANATLSTADAALAVAKAAGRLVPPDPSFGTNAIGSMFHVHRGRCYAAGNPAFPMTLLYSDAMNSSGVSYWSATLGVNGELAGFIDISADLTTGDIITGITTHRGFIVVFCKNHILFYISQTKASGVLGHSLYKVVQGEGCVSPDAIQPVGEDVIFLSPNGFKKLSVSLIQGDSQVNDVSQPINNVIKRKLRPMTQIQLDKISSSYNPTYGLYMCSFGDGDVWVMQPAFDGWFLWQGLIGNLFTASTQETYYLDATINKLTNTAFSDNGLPVVMSWETSPFKAGTDVQIRWNKASVIYESTGAASLTLSSFIDLNVATKQTSIIPTTPTAVQTGAILEGTVKIPLSARGELLSIIVSNADMIDFRFKLIEAYVNTGGIRE